VNRPPRFPPAPALPDVPPGTLALGWATVELDRAAVELAAHLVPGERFRDAPSSVALGARARLGRMRLPDDREIWLVLLEPDTEGRLAATLARAGEGWAATWVIAGPEGVTGPDGEPSTRPVARQGPLGAERLVPGGPPAGPHRLLVEAATIAP
jgi:hypothetical protein